MVENDQKSFELWKIYPFLLKNSFYDLMSSVSITIPIGKVTKKKKKKKSPKEKKSANLFSDHLPGPDHDWEGGNKVK